MIPRLPLRLCGLLLACLLAGGCSFEPAPSEITDQQPPGVDTMDSARETDEPSAAKSLETATFAAGCYWCTEAVFQRLEGVENVVSGFMGGHVDNPSYEAVCLGTTGHAEVIQFNYDPNRVTYEELLEVFWKTHDPTTLNRQGADVGTQYRSAVFYHTDEQGRLAESYKQKLDEAKIFEDPIVTEISEASTFYAAKPEHQDFYNANPSHGYCGYIIRPKIKKLEAVFADKLKKP